MARFTFQRRQWHCSALFALSILFLSPSRLWASAGTEGASFLDIPVGARSAALGWAYTALATDAYAPVWNPAGLGFISNTEVAAQHLSYLESVHHEYLGLGQPLGHFGGFGASIQYLGSGDIPSTDNGGNSIGTFSSHFASYNAAYGLPLGDALAVGVTGKWIDARIDDFTAHAYAADLGALYHPNDRWSVGATVTNIGSKLTFISAGDSLPLEGHLGAAFWPTKEWLVTAEAVESANHVTNGRGGVEWRPIPWCALRAGYKSDTVQGLSALAGMTAGIGLNFWGGEFAYAWLPLGDLGNGQYFSYSYRFGTGDERHRNLVYYRPLKHHEHFDFPGADKLSSSDIEAVIELITAPEKAPLAQSSSIVAEETR